MESLVQRAASAAVGLAGAYFVVAGLWARRDVRRTLEQERVSSNGGERVASAAGARALAELIRRHTLEATDGRTYAEVEPYLDVEGRPTSDAAQAARNELTRQPVENPDHALWIQSTTLQTALIQGHVAFRLSELTVALGAAFVAAGAGLATGRPPSRARGPARRSGAPSSRPSARPPR
jgi:hypothetical protein